MVRLKPIQFVSLEPEPLAQYVDKYVVVEISNAALRFKSTNVDTRLESVARTISMCIIVTAISVQ